MTDLPNNSAIIPVTPVVEPSMTIDEFCLAERISRATYFKLVRTGYGPGTICLPGTRVTRITAEARREWQRKMAAMQTDEKVERERLLRSNAARRAGNLAAASPRHICKNPQNRKKRGAR
jgi:hypothetical protein